MLRHGRWPAASEVRRRPIGSPPPTTSTLAYKINNINNKLEQLDEKISIINPDTIAFLDNKIATLDAKIDNLIKHIMTIVPTTGKDKENLDNTIANIDLKLAGLIKQSLLPTNLTSKIDKITDGLKHHNIESRTFNDKIANIDAKVTNIAKQIIAKGPMEKDKQNLDNKITNIEAKLADLTEQIQNHLMSPTNLMPTITSIAQESKELAANMYVVLDSFNHLQHRLFPYDEDESENDDPFDPLEPIGGKHDGLQQALVAGARQSSAAKAHGTAPLPTASLGNGSISQQRFATPMPEAQHGEVWH